MLYVVFADRIARPADGSEPMGGIDRLALAMVSRPW